VENKSDRPSQTAQYLVGCKTGEQTSTAVYAAVAQIPDLSQALCRILFDLETVKLHCNVFLETKKSVRFQYNANCLKSTVKTAGKRTY